MLRWFDLYVHGYVDRRGFLNGVAKYAVGGVTATMLLESLRPKFAEARQIAMDDKRIKARFVEFPSPEGYGTVRAYLVSPANASGKLPGVLVVHENRGLNPHIGDIARRIALDNFLATRLPDLGAAVPFYGARPAAEDVAKIKAPLLIHYAENDQRINAGWPAYEAALKAAGVKYEMFQYPGTQHGFNNDTTPRSDSAAAKLAWSRTMDFFNKNLRLGRLAASVGVVV